MLPLRSSATNKLPSGPTASPVGRPTRFVAVVPKLVKNGFHCAAGSLQFTAIAGWPPVNGTYATCGAAAAAKGSAFLTSAETSRKWHTLV